MSQTSSTLETGRPELTRRYDVDWLRVLGMMTVFLFHTNRFFDTEGWHVKSVQTSRASMLVTIFAVQWMMPLFFILSGIGIYHALTHQTWPQYLASRVKRLAVPLLFGIFVIIAPWQVYLERVSHNQYSGSFWSWYPHYFDGWYGLGGNFAWMGVHLWYLEFLFVFSVITLPLFLYLQSPSGVHLLDRLSRLLRRWAAIFLPAVAIAILTFLSTIPAIKNSILGNEGFGGWSFFPYVGMLIIGYLLATHEELAQTMERHRLPGLLLGILWFVLGGALYEATQDWPWLPRGLVMSPIRAILCWSWLIAICGYASRHLRFSNPFLKYANEAVLPFYILHQTIILTIGFYVLRLNTSLWVEYLIIATSSFMVIMAVYELLIRRLNVLRFLFGLKPLRRRQFAPQPLPST